MSKTTNIRNHCVRTVGRIAGWALLWFCSFATQPAWSQEAPFILDSDCSISILNRTIFANEFGRFAMPNVPSFLGQIRARATCIRGGVTTTGQTEYFNVITNDVINSGSFFSGNNEQIPESIEFIGGNIATIFGAGNTLQLLVTANFPDGTQADVTASDSGINYNTSNQQILTVDAEGLVTAVATGSALVSARKDGVIVVTRVTVSDSGDSDGDGLPDDFELSVGLDPLDPVDAMEDQDRDGLSALEEFTLGTDVNLVDTDGDGIDDGEEVVAGDDGFITNPLLEDTDGDGIGDGLEVDSGTDPTDETSGDVSSLLVSIEVTPASLNLVYDTIRTEASAQLQVTGTLFDGSERDITFFGTGTTYSSSDITVANFGADAGQIFAGQDGSATITVSNGGFQVDVPVEVQSFSPTPLSKVDLPSFGNNVDIDADYAFVAGGNGGMHVIDTADKLNPQLVATLPLPGVAIDIKVRSNLAYIAGGKDGLHIVDISDPLAPVLVSTLDTSGIAYDIALAGRILYLADGRYGIKVIDIQDPARPILIGGFGTGNANGLDINGDVLVVSNHTFPVTVLDVSNPQNPIRRGSIGIPAQTYDVQWVPPYAYIATSRGLFVIDLVTPNVPQVLGFFGNGGWATDVHLGPNEFLFATQVQPITPGPIYDVSDPASPAFVALPTYSDISGVGSADLTGLAADHRYLYAPAGGPQVDYKPGPNSSSRFVIGQYSGRTDLALIAPEVVLTAPADAGVVIAGQTLLMTADASDDVVVSFVEFMVDGVVVGRDSTVPYQVDYPVPNEIRDFTFSAQAMDLGGNVGLSAEQTFTSQPDTDGDGLSDVREQTVYFTDPNNPDSDGDGLNDGEEVARGIDPNVVDTDGDGLTDGEEVANDTDPRNPDTLPPVVVLTTPADNEIDVPENAPVQIMFDEPLSFGSISSISVRVLELGLFDVSGTLSLIGTSNEISFRPEVNFQDFTDYTVILDGVKDLAGNPLAAPYQFSFTTGNISDFERPQVIRSNPVDKATDVPTNVMIGVDLNERIDPATVDGTSIYLEDPVGGVDINGVVTVSGDGRTLNFTPNRVLPVGRTLNLVVTSQIEDFFGNNMVSSNFEFTTRFAADVQSPTIVATTVIEGQTEVPQNVKLNVLFDEPISNLTLDQIRLDQAGSPVLVSRSLSTDRLTVTLEPLVPLATNTQYLLDIGAIEDTSGNPLSVPRQIGFTTGASSDISGGVVQVSSPFSNVSNVPLDANFEFQVSEALDPTSLTSSRVYLENRNTRRRVDATLSLSADSRRVTLNPVDLLEADNLFTAYISYGGGLTDFAGNQITRRSTSFNTGDFVTGGDPIVSAVNFDEDTSSVPLNAAIELAFDQMMSSPCVGSDTVNLSDASGDIAGSVSLSADGLTLIFDPDSNLDPNTSYTLTLDGVCSITGAALPLYSYSFTTGTAVDTTRPLFIDITPSHQAIGVDVNTSITVVFNEVLDPVYFSDRVQSNGIAVTDENNTAIAGTWTLNVDTATFTPLNPLPGNRRINVRINGGAVADQAGNINSNVTRYFDTEAVLDTTPPQIISITPEDGAMDVNRSTDVVLTFSESLNRTDITDDNFLVYADGEFLTTTVTRSLDNRTVTIDRSWPASQPISVIVTSDVRDLSGNALSDFVSVFSTGVVSETLRPRVLRQAPRYGASAADGSQPIVLYFNEPMDTSSFDDSFYVSADGVLVSGSIEFSDGLALVFTPDVPFADGALVQTNLLSTATDLSGNAVYAYQGVYRIDIDSETVGIAPLVIDFNPADRSRNSPLNPRIQAAYNQSLNPGTVNETSVSLVNSVTTIPVPVSVSLSGSNRIVEVTPLAPLEPGTPYTLNLEDTIEDTDGELQARLYRSFFTTAADATVDNQAPLSLAVSPPDGTVGVPLNPRYHVWFDEPINSLSFVDLQGIDLQFESNNQGLYYSRFLPLPVDADVTENIPPIEDIAGNPGLASSTSFRTSSTFDIIAPQVDGFTTPANNDRVPVNVGVRLTIDEAIDPASIERRGVTVSDLDLGGAGIPGTTTLESDGRTIVWVPDAPLPVGREIRASFNFDDLSGNSGSVGFDFFTLFDADFTAPQIVDTTVLEGQTDVPTNARLRVRFDEAINRSKISAVRILIGGTPQPVNISFSPDGTLLTLTPRQLLPANSIAIFEIAGIEDLSGNPMLSDRQVSFTTASGVDNQRASVIALSPSPFIEGAPLNSIVEFEIDEPIDRTFLNEQYVYVEDQSNGDRVSATLALSADGRRVTAAPLGLLDANREYRAYLGSNPRYLLDLAGNRVNSRTVIFTTGQELYVNPPLAIENNLSGNTSAVPTNVDVSVQFDTLLSELCVNTGTVILSDGAVQISGSVSLGSDGRTVTFTPDLELQANTSYTFDINGICGASGQAQSGFSLGFITAAAADSQQPTVTAITPTNQSTGVTVTTDIVVQFSEVLDPITFYQSVGNNLLRVFDANGDNFSGEWVLNGDTATFTPLTPLPGLSRVNVRFERLALYDRAGNRNSGFFVYYFETDAVFDTTPPQVLSITPNDGALDIDFAADIVLVFSESLNSNTVNRDNFLIYADGNIIEPGVSRSIDNRTVTLSGSWPKGQPITVIATSGVLDLSGNALADFTSLFSTTLTADGTRPTVINKYFDNRADGTGPIVLYFSEELEQSSLNGALEISQNGVSVSGTQTLTSARTLQFVPDVPFVEGALIQVDLLSSATDLAGNAIIPYQDSYVIATQPVSAGVTPRVIGSVPDSGQSNVPINPVFLIAFDQVLNPASVTPDRVSLQLVSGSVDVPSTISLLDGDQVVQVVPDSFLNPNMVYRLTISGVEDIDGDVQSNGYSIFMSTDSAGIEDNQPPRVIVFSPPDGSVEVPVNPRYHLRFDEAVNILNFSEPGLNAVFSSDDRELTYSRALPLPTDSDITENAPPVVDLAGNVVVPASTSFRTGVDIDTLAPSFEDLRTPFVNSTVPTNSFARIKMTEPVDSAALDSTIFYIEDWDNGRVRVPGVVSLEGDGRTITWVPDAELQPNTRFRLNLSQVPDLSGNRSGSLSYYFFSDATSDSTPPSVLVTTVFEGQTGLPTNARLRVRFDEAIDRTRLDGVEISVAGVPLPYNVEFNADGRLMTLAPKQLLPANSDILLTVADVSDLAGNFQVTPFQVGFTTASGVDYEAGDISAIAPSQDLEDVPLNTLLRFRTSERIDPTTLTSNEVYLRNLSESQDVSSTLSLTPDGREITLTPDAPLNPQQLYQSYIGYGDSVWDLAGNEIQRRNTRFTTGNSVASLAPAIVDHNLSLGTDAVALNAPVRLRYDQLLSETCASEDNVLLTDGVVDLPTNIVLGSDSFGLTIDPVTDLSPSTVHTLTLNGICGLSGLESSTFNLVFTTGTAIDTSGPFITSFTPVNRSVDVPTDSTILVEVNELIDPVDFASKLAQLNQIRVYDQSNVDIAGDWTINGTQLEFTPDVPFAPDTRINFLLQRSALMDQAGNRRSTIYSYYFTTGSL